MSEETDLTEEHYNWLRDAADIPQQVCSGYAIR
jgi:hypothetical protein